MRSNPKLSTPVTELLPGDITSTPITVEGWDGDDLINDEWSFWQSTSYSVGDREITIVADGHGSIVQAMDDAGRATDPQDVDDYKESTRDDEDGRTDRDALTDDELTALETADDVYEYAEGPMMNYWYPCPTVEDDPAEAALALDGLPVCVVNIDGQGWGLALTGGGMDLSWEIAEAFCRLGMLPPVHFADLPGMAFSRDENSRAVRAYVVAAMLRSLEVTSERAMWARERLTNSYADLLNG